MGEAIHTHTWRRWLGSAAIAIVGGLAIFSSSALAETATVSSFDGTQIHVNFFPAAGLADGQRAPTVLMGPGWSQPGETNPDSATDPSVGAVGVGSLRGAGYNVLTWDPRGFGSSGGQVEVDSPDYEGRDVSALLDWIAQRPDAELDGAGDPRVGMAGASYGGGIQLVAAAIDDRVDAIVPSIAWSSLVTSLYKDETVKTGWGSILYLLATGHSTDPVLTDAFATGLATGRFTPEQVEFLASRGPGELVDRIHVPTLLIQGTVDTLFTLQEAVVNYEILRGNDVPVKMLWFCGGHGSCFTDPGDAGRIERDTLAWLARYLKDDATIDTGPRFEWLDQDGRSYSADDLPQSSSALEAEGSGTLPVTQAGGSGLAVDLDPSIGPVALLAAPIAATQALNAVNVPIPAPTAEQPIVGAPRVTLSYSGTAAPASDTRVYAQVVDATTGKVLGNQLTPIPVTLDGEQHTIARPLEQIAATAGPSSSFTLQLTAGTTAYDPQRSVGAIRFSSVHVALPIADLSPSSDPGSTEPRPQPSSDASTVGPPTIASPSVASVIPGSATHSPHRSRPCHSRRVTLRLPARYRHRHRLRRARVLVGSRRAATVPRGAKKISVKLRGAKTRPAPVTVIRIALRLRNGRTVTLTHRLRAC